MATMAIGAGMAAAGGIISALNSAPSAAQLTLNSQLQDMTKFMQGQAKTEGIDASSVFQKVMGPLTRVLQGGPQQAGWSNAQVSAYNAAATNAAAAKARDIGGLGTGATTGTVSFGQSVGSTAAQTMAAKQAAEDLRATTVATGEQASATAGREEFNEAVKGAESSTEAFKSANEAAAAMPAQEKLGLESQASVDAAQKAASWSGIASKALTSAGGSMMGAAGQPKVPGTGSSPSGNPIGGFEGAQQNLDTTKGSSPWEQVKNWGAGFLGKRTGPSSGLPGMPPSGGGGEGDFLGND
jgi:hypothetical protein